MTISLTEPRIFASMPAAEARAVFEEFVRLHPARLDGFLVMVRRRRGPADRLDFSLESLESLWQWFVPAHRHRWYSSDPHRMPRAPLRPDQVRPEDPMPWWAPFHPAFYLELGPRVASAVDGLSAYVFEVVMRERPASRWMMGKGRSMSHFQSPVLKVEGRVELDYGAPIVWALHALRGQHREDEQAYLRIGVERWLGLDPEWEAQIAALSRPMPEYAVEPVQHPHFSHVVSFRNELGHRQTARIDRMIARLAGEPGIDEAVREDREVVLIAAGGASGESVTAAVERAWSAARRK
jgi:hypothetical protein